MKVQNLFPSKIYMHTVRYSSKFSVVENFCNFHNYENYKYENFCINGTIKACYRIGELVQVL